MVEDILLGAVFGGVGAWAAYAGILGEFYGLHGKSVFATVPKFFWPVSGYVAGAGTILGAVLMWLAKR